MIPGAPATFFAFADFFLAAAQPLNGAWIPSIADEVATVTRTALARLLALERYLLLAPRVAMRFIVAASIFSPRLGRWNCLRSMHYRESILARSHFRFRFDQPDRLQGGLICAARAV